MGQTIIHRCKVILERERNYDAAANDPGFVLRYFDGSRAYGSVIAPQLHCPYCGKDVMREDRLREDASVTFR